MNFLDLLFPKLCLKCKKKGSYICNSCFKKATVVGEICPYCDRLSFFGKTHDECIRENRLDGLISIWKYKGVIKEAILKLKYNFAKSVALDLGRWASLSLKNKNLNFKGNVVLVPIPLHKTRENWRGFNQSAEIGKVVAKNLNWKVEENLILRLKQGIPQVNLGKKKRLRNMRGKFAVNMRLKDKLRAQHIVLFDDVWTTGSTMKEACLILKKSGFKNVWGITVAR